MRRILAGKIRANGSSREPCHAHAARDRDGTFEVRRVAHQRGQRVLGWLGEHAPARLLDGEVVEREPHAVRR